MMTPPPAVAVHHAAGVDQNVVRRARLDRRGPDRTVDGSGNGRLRDRPARPAATNAGRSKQEIDASMSPMFATGDRSRRRRLAFSRSDGDAADLPWKFF